MIRLFDSAKARVGGFPARPLLARIAGAYPYKLSFQQIEKRLISTPMLDTILKQKQEWKFRWQGWTDIFKPRPSPTILNVPPLAPLIINKYVPGRVFCLQRRIFFQVSGAAHFEKLCNTILSSTLTCGQLRPFSLDEVRRLKRNQMVLCSENLSGLMLWHESGSGDVCRFAVPGALYRGRLLQNGDIIPPVLSDCEEEDWAFDRLNVKLVDFGITGSAHVTKLMPMPDAVIKIPAMAIRGGYTEGQYMKYDGKTWLDGVPVGYLFEECCNYVQNAKFMPTRLHSHDDHRPSKEGVRWFPGTCIRHVDGLIKFDMPDNVEGIPERVVKLIGNDLPFEIDI